MCIEVIQKIFVATYRKIPGLAGDVSGDVANYLVFSEILYIGIGADRKAIARYGLSIEDIQRYIGVAVGGNPLTTTVEGRERYNVRVRYARELRDSPEALKDILIPTSNGVQIPLEELASLSYIRGPQNIRSENTFLVSYVIFDKEENFAFDFVSSRDEEILI